MADSTAGAAITAAVKQAVGIAKATNHSALVHNLLLPSTAFQATIDTLMSNDLTSVRQRLKENRRTIATSWHLSVEDEVYLSDTFPHVAIVSAGTKSYCSHARARMASNIVLEEIYNNPRVKGKTVSEAGAQYPKHLKAGRIVHSCNPILSARDSERARRHGDSASNIVKSITKKLDNSEVYPMSEADVATYAAIKAFAEPRGLCAGICQNKIQHCEVQCQVIVMHDVAYDVAPDELFDAMINKGADFGVVSMLRFSDLLIGDSGEIADLNCHWQVELPTGPVQYGESVRSPARTKGKFSFWFDKGSTGYTHDVDILRSWLYIPQTTHYKGWTFFVETKEYGPYQVLEITKTSGLLRGELSVRPLLLSTAADKVILKSSVCTDAKTKAFRPATIILNKDFYVKVSAWVSSQRQSHTDFLSLDRHTYNQYFAVSQYRIIVDGKTVYHRAGLTSSDVFSVAEAVLFCIWEGIQKAQITAETYSKVWELEDKKTDSCLEGMDWACLGTPSERLKNTLLRREKTVRKEKHPFLPEVELEPEEVVRTPAASFYDYLVSKFKPIVYGSNTTYFETQYPRAMLPDMLQTKVYTKDSDGNEDNVQNINLDFLEHIQDYTSLKKKKYDASLVSKVTTCMTSCSKKKRTLVRNMKLAILPFPDQFAKVLNKKLRDHLEHRWLDLLTNRTEDHTQCIYQWNRDPRHHFHVVSPDLYHCTKCYRSGDTIHCSGGCTKTGILCVDCNDRSDPECCYRYKHTRGATPHTFDQKDHLTAAAIWFSDSQKMTDGLIPSIRPHPMSDFLLSFHKKHREERCVVEYTPTKFEYQVTVNQDTQFQCRSCLSKGEKNAATIQCRQGCTITCENCLDYRCMCFRIRKIKQTPLKKDEYVPEFHRACKTLIGMGLRSTLPKTDADYYLDGLISAPCLDAVIQAKQKSVSPPPSCPMLCCFPSPTGTTPAPTALSQGSDTQVSTLGLFLGSTAHIEPELDDFYKTGNPPPLSWCRPVNEGLTMTRQCNTNSDWTLEDGQSFPVVTSHVLNWKNFKGEKEASFSTDCGRLSIDLVEMKGSYSDGLVFPVVDKNSDSHIWHAASQPLPQEIQNYLDNPIVTKFHWKGSPIQVDLHRKWININGELMPLMKRPSFPPPDLDLSWTLGTHKLTKAESLILELALITITHPFVLSTSCGSYCIDFQTGFATPKEQHVQYWSRHRVHFEDPPNKDLPWTEPTAPPSHLESIQSTDTFTDVSSLPSTTPHPMPSAPPTQTENIQTSSVRYKSVKLTRDENGVFGISIGSDMEGLGAVITGINKDIPNIALGDRIIRLNGTDCLGLTHDEILTAFKKWDEITLILLADPNYSPHWHSIQDFLHRESVKQLQKREDPHPPSSEKSLGMSEDRLPKKKKEAEENLITFTESSTDCELDDFSSLSSGETYSGPADPSHGPVGSKSPLIDFLRSSELYETPKDDSDPGHVYYETAIDEDAIQLPGPTKKPPPESCDFMCQMGIKCEKGHSFSCADGRFVPLKTASSVDFSDLIIKLRRQLCVSSKTHPPMIWLPNNPNRLPRQKMLALIEFLTVTQQQCYSTVEVVTSARIVKSGKKYHLQGPAGVKYRNYKAKLVSKYDPEKQDLMMYSDTLKKFARHSQIPPNTVVIQPDDEYYFALETMYAIRHREFDLEDFDLTVVPGVPGCGKSYSIAHAAQEDDLIVTMTKSSRDEIRDMLDGLGMKKVQVKTAGSILINPTSFRPTRVLFDEVWNSHYGLSVLMFGGLVQCQRVIGFGDPNQIPYINRVSGMDALSHATYPEITGTPMAVSRRCPADAVLLIAEAYDYPIQTVSRVRRSITVRPYTELSSVLNEHPNAILLTMYVDEEKGLKASYPKREVKTVHCSQGGTWDEVILVRSKPASVSLDLHLLRRGKINPHMLVALSRHRKKFVYVTTTMNDGLSQKISNAKISDADLDKVCVSQAPDPSEIIRTVTNKDIHLYQHLGEDETKTVRIGTEGDLDPRDPDLQRNWSEFVKTIGIPIKILVYQENTPACAKITEQLEKFLRPAQTMNIVIVPPIHPSDIDSPSLTHVLDGVEVLQAGNRPPSAYRYVPFQPTCWYEVACRIYQRYSGLPKPEPGYFYHWTEKEGTKPKDEQCPFLMASMLLSFVLDIPLLLYKSDDGAPIGSYSDNHFSLENDLATPLCVSSYRAVGSEADLEGVLDMNNAYEMLYRQEEENSKGLAPPLTSEQMAILTEHKEWRTIPTQTNRSGGKLKRLMTLYPSYFNGLQSVTDISPAPGGMALELNAMDVHVNVVHYQFKKTKKADGSLPLKLINLKNPPDNMSCEIRNSRFEDDPLDLPAADLLLSDIGTTAPDLTFYEPIVEKFLRVSRSFKSALFKVQIRDFTVLEYIERKFAGWTYLDCDLLCPGSLEFWILKHPTAPSSSLREMLGHRYVKSYAYQHRLKGAGMEKYYKVCEALVGEPGVVDVVEKTIPAYKEYELSDVRIEFMEKMKTWVPVVEEKQYLDLHAYPRYDLPYIQESFDSPKTAVGTMQDLYDTILPAVATEDLSFDNVLTDFSDLDLDLNDVTFPIMHLASSKLDFHKVRPALRTGVSPDMPQSARSTLTALSKRNCGTVYQTDLSYPEYQQDRAIERFFKYMCKTDYKAYLEEYQNNPVVMTRDAIEDYVGSVELGKIKTINQRGLNHPSTYAYDEHEFSIKRKIKNSMDNTPLHTLGRSQTVMAHRPELVAYTTPIWKILRNRMAQILSPKWLMIIGPNGSNIQDFMNANIPVSASDELEEMDIKGFDKSLSYNMTMATWKLARMLGLPEDEWNRWCEGQAESTYINYRYNIKGKLHYQTHSGVASTILTNTMACMLALASVLDDVQLECGMAVGDDSLVRVLGKKITGEQEKKFATLWNLEVKRVTCGAPYFCGILAGGTPYGWLLVPDILKRIERLGKHSLSEVDMDEMRVSLKDQLKIYTNGYALDVAAELHTRRYGPGPWRQAARALTIVAFSKGSFNMLFDRMDQLRARKKSRATAAEIFSA